MSFFQSRTGLCMYRIYRCTRLVVLSDEKISHNQHTVLVDLPQVTTAFVGGLQCVACSLPWSFQTQTRTFHEVSINTYSCYRGLGVPKPPDFGRSWITQGTMFGATSYRPEPVTVGQLVPQGGYIWGFPGEDSGEDGEEATHIHTKERALKEHDSSSFRK